ncbi:hypothetical protein IKF26_01975 [Candidatus Saccharibacteria bacterium]|nr:hypothetical protein [Candidatus Saccharibacteria bacterium]
MARRTLSMAEAIYKIESISTSKNNDSDRESAKSLEVQFASATIYLQLMMTTIVMCDRATKEGELTPEMAQLIGSLSDNLRQSVYGLDKAIGDIADQYNFDRWVPICYFEEDLIRHLEQN